MRKRDLVKELRAFEGLSDAEKIAARLKWLEQSTFDLLCLTSSLSGLAASAVGIWFLREEIGIRSLWVLVPMGLIVFLGVGWWVQRRAFRDAPPHIDFLDRRL